MNDYLPDVWENEEKISFLFEEPRSSSVNPLDVEHKYKFWSEAIKRWYITCRKSSFTMEEVKEAFRRKGRVPAYLQNTVLRMEREGFLKRFSEAVEEAKKCDTGSVTLTSRLFSMMVVSPVKYGITTAKWALGYNSEELSDSTRFIAIEVVEEKSNEIGKALKSKPGISMYTVASFYTEYKHVVSDEEESYLLFGQLMKKSDLFVERDGDTFIVKIPTEKQDKVQHTPIRQKPLQAVTTIKSPVSASNQPITEAERSLAKISKTIELLHEEISTICEECQDLREKAAAFLKQGSRGQAKIFLRKKKRLEQLAEKRATALTQLEILQESLVDADTDSVVLDAYKTAKDALKSTIKDQLHGVIGVEATLDDLNEVLEDHAGISAALAEPVRPSEDVVSMEELEDELQELLKEDAELPEPPKEPPRTQPSEDDLMERLEALRGERVTFNLPDTPETRIPERKKEKVGI